MINRIIKELVKIFGRNVLEEWVPISKLQLLSVASPEILIENIPLPDRLFKSPSIPFVHVQSNIGRVRIKCPWKALFRSTGKVVLNVRIDHVTLVLGIKSLKDLDPDFIQDLYAKDKAKIIGRYEACMRLFTISNTKSGASACRIVNALSCEIRSVNVELVDDLLGPPRSLKFVVEKLFVKGIDPNEPSVNATEKDGIYKNSLTALWFTCTGLHAWFSEFDDEDDKNVIGEDATATFEVPTFETATHAHTQNKATVASSFNDQAHLGEENDDGDFYDDDNWLSTSTSTGPSDNELSEDLDHNDNGEWTSTDSESEVFGTTTGCAYDSTTPNVPMGLASLHQWQKLSPRFKYLISLSKSPKKSYRITPPEGMKLDMILKRWNVSALAQVPESSQEAYNSFGLYFSAVDKDKCSNGEIPRFDGSVLYKPFDLVLAGGAIEFVYNTIRMCQISSAIRATAQAQQMPTPEQCKEYLQAKYVGSNVTDAKVIVDEFCARTPVHVLTWLTKQWINPGTVGCCNTVPSDFNQVHDDSIYGHWFFSDSKFEFVCANCTILVLPHLDFGNQTSKMSPRRNQRTKNYSSTTDPCAACSNLVDDNVCRGIALEFSCFAVRNESCHKRSTTTIYASRAYLRRGTARARLRTSSFNANIDHTSMPLCDEVLLYPEMLFGDAGAFFKDFGYSVAGFNMNIPTGLLFSVAMHNFNNGYKTIKVNIPRMVLELPVLQELIDDYGWAKLDNFSKTFVTFESYGHHCNRWKCGNDDFIEAVIDHAYAKGSRSLVIVNMDQLTFDNRNATHRTLDENTTRPFEYDDNASSSDDAGATSHAFVSCKPKKKGGCFCNRYNGMQLDHVVFANDLIIEAWRRCATIRDPMGKGGESKPGDITLYSKEDFINNGTGVDEKSLRTNASANFHGSLATLNSPQLCKDNLVHIDAILDHLVKLRAWNKNTRGKKPCNVSLEMVVGRGVCVWYDSSSKLNLITVANCNIDCDVFLSNLEFVRSDVWTRAVLDFASLGSLMDILDLVDLLAKPLDVEIHRIIRFSDALKNLYKQSPLQHGQNVCVKAVPIVYDENAPKVNQTDQKIDGVPTVDSISNALVKFLALDNFGQVHAAAFGPLMDAIKGACATSTKALGRVYMDFKNAKIRLEHNLHLDLLGAVADISNYQHKQHVKLAIHRIEIANTTDTTGATATPAVLLASVPDRSERDDCNETRAVKRDQIAMDVTLSSPNNSKIVASVQVTNVHLHMVASLINQCLEVSKRIRETVDLLRKNFGTSADVVTANNDTRLSSQAKRCRHISEHSAGDGALLGGDNQKIKRDSTETSGKSSRNAIESANTLYKTLQRIIMDRHDIALEVANVVFYLNGIAVEYNVFLGIKTVEAKLEISVPRFHCTLVDVGTTSRLCTLSFLNLTLILGSLQGGMSLEWNLGHICVWGYSNDDSGTKYKVGNIDEFLFENWLNPTTRVLLPSGSGPKWQILLPLLQTRFDPRERLKILLRDPVASKCTSAIEDALRTQVQHTTGARGIVGNAHIMVQHDFAILDADVHVCDVVLSVHYECMLSILRAFDRIANLLATVSTHKRGRSSGRKSSLDSFKSGYACRARVAVSKVQVIITRHCAQGIGLLASMLPKAARAGQKNTIEDSDDLDSYRIASLASLGRCRLDISTNIQVLAQAKTSIDVLSQIESTLLNDALQELMDQSTLYQNYKWLCNVTCPSVDASLHDVGKYDRNGNGYGNGHKDDTRLVLDCRIWHLDIDALKSYEVEVGTVGKLKIGSCNLCGTSGNRLLENVAEIRNNGYPVGMNGDVSEKSLVGGGANSFAHAQSSLHDNISASGGCSSKSTNQFVAKISISREKDKDEEKTLVMALEDCRCRIHAATMRDLLQLAQDLDFTDCSPCSAPTSESPDEANRTSTSKNSNTLKKNWNVTLALVALELWLETEPNMVPQGVPPILGLITTSTIWNTPSFSQTIQYLSVAMGHVKNVGTHHQVLVDSKDDELFFGTHESRDSILFETHEGYVCTRTSSGSATSLVINLGRPHVSISVDCMVELQILVPLLVKHYGFLKSTSPPKACQNHENIKIGTLWGEVMVGPDEYDRNNSGEVEGNTNNPATGTFHNTCTEGITDLELLSLHLERTFRKCKAECPKIKSFTCTSLACRNYKSLDIPLGKLQEIGSNYNVCLHASECTCKLSCGIAELVLTLEIQKISFAWCPTNNIHTGHGIFSIYTTNTSNIASTVLKTCTVSLNVDCRDPSSILGKANISGIALEINPDLVQLFHRFKFISDLLSKDAPQGPMVQVKLQNRLDVDIYVCRKKPTRGLDDLVHVPANSSLELSAGELYVFLADTLNSEGGNNNNNNGAYTNSHSGVWMQEHGKNLLLGNSYNVKRLLNAINDKENDRHFEIVDLGACNLLFLGQYKIQQGNARLFNVPQAGDSVFMDTCRSQVDDYLQVSIGTFITIENSTQIPLVIEHDPKFNPIFSVAKFAQQPVEFKCLRIAPQSTVCVPLEWCGSSIMPAITPVLLNHTYKESQPLYTLYNIISKPWHNQHGKIVYLKFGNRLALKQTIATTEVGGSNNAFGYRIMFEPMLKIRNYLFRPITVTLARDKAHLNTPDVNATKTGIMEHGHTSVYLEPNQSWGFAVGEQSLVVKVRAHGSILEWSKAETYLSQWEYTTLPFHCYLPNSGTSTFTKPAKLVVGAVNQFFSNAFPGCTTQHAEAYKTTKITFECSRHEVVVTWPMKFENLSSASIFINGYAIPPGARLHGNTSDASNSSICAVGSSIHTRMDLTSTSVWRNPLVLLVPSVAANNGGILTSDPTTVGEKFKGENYDTQSPVISAGVNTSGNSKPSELDYDAIVSLVKDTYMEHARPRRGYLTKRTTGDATGNDVREFNGDKSAAVAANILDEDWTLPNDQYTCLVLGCTVRFHPPPLGIAKTVTICDLYQIVNRLPFDICLRALTAEGLPLGQALDVLVPSGSCGSFHSPFDYAYIVNTRDGTCSGKFMLHHTRVPTVLQLELTSRQVPYTNIANPSLLIQINVISGTFEGQSLPYTYNGYYFVVDLARVPQYQVLNLTSYTIAYANVGSTEDDYLLHPMTDDEAQYCLTGPVDKVGILPGNGHLVHYAPLIRLGQDPKVALRLVLDASCGGEKSDTADINDGEKNQAGPRITQYCEWHLRPCTVIKDATAIFSGPYMCYQTTMIGCNGTRIITLVESRVVALELCGFKSDSNMQALSSNVSLTLEVPRISVTLATKSSIVLALHLNSIQANLLHKSIQGQVGSTSICSSIDVRSIHLDHFVEGFIPVVLKSGLGLTGDSGESFLHVKILCSNFAFYTVPIFDLIHLRVSSLAVNIEMRVLEQLFDLFEGMFTTRIQVTSGVDNRTLIAPSPRWIEMKPTSLFYIRKLIIDPLCLVLAIRTSQVKLTRYYLQILDALPLDTPCVYVHFAAERRSCIMQSWGEMLHCLGHSYKKQLIRQSLPSAWLSNSFAVLSGLWRGAILLVTRPVVTACKFKNFAEGFFLGFGNGLLLFCLYIIGGSFQTLGHVLNVLHKLVGSSRPKPLGILDAVWLGFNGMALNVLYKPWKRLILDYKDSRGRDDSAWKIGIGLVANIARCALCPVLGLVNCALVIVEGFLVVLLGDFENLSHVYESEQLKTNASANVAATTRATISKAHERATHTERLVHRLKSMSIRRRP